jgi:hypothetical protein
LEPENNTDQRKLAEAYIAQYTPVAVMEKARTGIPVSIKLAQAMLESDWGRSDMAVSANNHFGIKCGQDWNGETFYKFDDEKEADGTPKKSCFRSFSSVEESFRAHSDFLANPSKKSRYGFLFALPANDYISWAKGLKDAGYATDPSYPEKLIRIIENYELHKLDGLATSSGIASSGTETVVQPVMKKVRDVYVPEKKNAPKRLPEMYEKQENNDVTYIRAGGGESIGHIASVLGLDAQDIVTFNDHKYYTDTELAEGTRIYVEMKKRFNEISDFHVVEEEESLFDIAQMYAVRLSILASRNNLTEVSILSPGTRLFINKTNQIPENRRSMPVRKESFIDISVASKQ